MVKRISGGSVIIGPTHFFYYYYYYYFFFLIRQFIEINFELKKYRGFQIEKNQTDPFKAIIIDQMILNIFNEDDSDETRCLLKVFFSPLNWLRSLFNLIVAMSVCLSVCPNSVDYSQIVFVFFLKN